MSLGYPDDLEQFVQNAIASGKFRSRDELISAVLTMFRHREEKLDRLREDIQIGIEQLERGEFTAITSPEEQIGFREKIKARGRERAGRESDPS
jgi:antitoxin ParD1/3/4